jgi:RNA polymerase sigma-70 factor (ECF subfamily)
MSTLKLPSAADPDLDDTLARSAHEQPEAFAVLYQRHIRKIYCYHLARTGNVADAQDLTSQTFMAALTGIAGFRGAGSFVAWLMGIAHNKCALFFRQRKPEVPLEAADDQLIPGMPTEQSVGERLKTEQLRRALNNLSPERAEAITLCLFGDLTSAEAGRVLGKSEAAVKMLVFRGLRDLRLQLAHGLDELI